MNGKLPKGWSSRPLADCGRWVSGGTPRRSEASYWGGNIPWISAKSLKVFDLNDSEDRVTKEGSENGTTLVPAGTILFVVRGMSLAKEFRVGVACREVTFNQDLRGIVPAKDVDPRFLGRYLRHAGQVVLSQADNAAHGTKRLPTERLRGLEVRLPRLAEQKRIAAILDQADTIRRHRRQAIDTIADLIPGIFQEMFGAFAADSQKCHTDTLATLGVEFRYGTSNKSESSGYPALRIPNVLRGAIDLTELKNVPVDYSEFERLQLRDGDLLFVRTNGNPDYVGRCAVFEPETVAAVDLDPNTFIYASYLIRGRVDRKHLNPQYVRAFLNTPNGRRMIRGQCRTSAGQYNINTKGLGGLQVPVPKIDLQDEFAHRAVDVVALQAKAALANAETDVLFDSLVQRAFRGEL